MQSNHRDYPTIFSSGPIQNEVLNINSEYPSSEYYFESKSQDKIYPSDQSCEKQEEQFIYFKKEHHDEFRKFHQDPSKKKMLTFNSEHLFSEDHFECKSQAEISLSEVSFDKQEEKLIDFQ